MVAESKALSQGLQLYIDKGFLKVDIEVDSMVLMQTLQKQVQTKVDCV